jgi:hypothetical protein
LPRLRGAGARADVVAGHSEQYHSTWSSASLLGESTARDDYRAVTRPRTDSMQVKDSLFKNPAVGAMLYNAGNIGVSPEAVLDLGVLAESRSR